MIRILALLLIVPFVELVLLLWLADRVGWLPTLGIIVGTALLGAFELRREGLRCQRRFREALQQGELPAEPLFDGLLILIAGALLLTPGLITDAVGFALLFPPSRAWIRAYLRRRVARYLHVSVDGMSFTSTGPFDPFEDDPSAGAKGRSGAQDDVIDVKFRDSD
ncbi:FxsA family protein [Thermopirellula anaerolimosa]